MQMPNDPRSSFNFGSIEGGTSVNSIPSSVKVKVDLRSEDEAELGRLEAAMREAMEAGVKEEISATQSANDALKMSVRSLGTRPAGKLPDDSPLLATIRNVDTLSPAIVRALNAARPTPTFLSPWEFPPWRLAGADAAAVRTLWTSGMTPRGGN